MIAHWAVHRLHLSMMPLRSGLSSETAHHPDASRYVATLLWHSETRPANQKHPFIESRNLGKYYSDILPEEHALIDLFFAIIASGLWHPDFD